MPGERAQWFFKSSCLTSRSGYFCLWKKFKGEYAFKNLIKQLNTCIGLPKWPLSQLFCGVSCAEVGGLGDLSKESLASHNVWGTEQWTGCFILSGVIQQLFPWRLVFGNAEQLDSSSAFIDWTFSEKQREKPCLWCWTRQICAFRMIMPAMHLVCPKLSLSYLECFAYFVCSIMHNSNISPFAVVAFIK